MTAITPGYNFLFYLYGYNIVILHMEKGVFDFYCHFLFALPWLIVQSGLSDDRRRKHKLNTNNYSIWSRGKQLLNFFAITY